MCYLYNNNNLSKKNLVLYQKYFESNLPQNFCEKYIKIGNESKKGNKKASLDKFKIISELESSTKQIFVAKHNTLKVILKKYAKKHTNIELLSEINNLQMFDHPNIVKIYDVFQDFYHVYLVLEYIDGGDLYSLENISEERAKNIFRQALDAVSECHKNNIIHRDIKTENFVITKNGVCKLIDFDLSIKKSSELLKDVTGTLDCLPPEMILNHPYNESVDIWCLGIFLAELVDENPFSQSDSLETKLKIKYIDYTPNENLNPQLLDLLAKIFKYSNTRITLPEIKEHIWLK